MLSQRVDGNADLPSTISLKQASTIAEIRIRPSRKSQKQSLRMSQRSSQAALGHPVHSTVFTALSFGPEDANIRSHTHRSTGSRTQANTMKNPESFTPRSPAPALGGLIGHAS